jgi:hypothetical protein
MTKKTHKLFRSKFGIYRKPLRRNFQQKPPALSEHLAFQTKKIFTFLPSSILRDYPFISVFSTCRAGPGGEGIEAAHAAGLPRIFHATLLILLIQVSLQITAG